MAGLRILVCGATGFIGRNMTEHFAAQPGVQVRAVHHRRPPFACTGVEWVQADLTRADDVARVAQGVDVIIQAAATTSGSKDITERPYIHTTDNAVMNAWLFRAAHEQGVRHLVYFSCTVMLPSSETPHTEDSFDANQPLHPRYFAAGWTKLYAEKMCDFYSGLGRTRYTVIRHSNIYGPHDKFDLERSHVFGATVTKVLTAPEGGTITVWGAGEEARDLLYVSDLVDFVQRAIEHQATPHELFNCGLGRATKVKDMVRQIVAQSGRALRIEHDLTKPSIPTTLTLDCSKARRLLGWQPQVAFEEGISRTLAWWRANPPAP
jgi:nucleoside-diphosphate-sugar epimerase